MNLLKVAFYQGANQALVDLGINKLAAKAAPITDNPYEDSPSETVKKVTGTSLEEIDDMFARIDSMSKSKQPAVAAKKPAPRGAPVRQTATMANGKPLTTYDFSDPDVITAKRPAAGAVRQTATMANGKPLTTYDFSDPDVITAKRPAPRVVAGKPRVTPVPGTGNKPSDGRLKALFPDSPGLVDAMRLGLTNQERQVGLSPKATGSAPPNAPKKPMGNS
jgi:hypothetical protein